MTQFKDAKKERSFSVSPDELSRFADVSLSEKFLMFPGFCDVHVHFREPGFSYKETIKTGALAAAHGGYTAVCTMPNLNPTPDDPERLSKQTEPIKRDACIRVYPFGTVTRGEKGEELSDIAGLAPYVIGYSDDGHGIQSESMMRSAMEKIRAEEKILSAHCEDNTLLYGGYIHDGVYAKEHGHRGISSESEWGPIRRDIALAKETGCAYHVCHISCKESVELIRQAKRDGVNITCETAPHYLLLDETDIKESGEWKMNPPLRGKADREALIEGLLDGTVDMIATDHAPHSAEEKSRGLERSSFGIVGIECAFPLLYTGLVKSGILSLDALITLLADNPRARFSIPQADDDFTVWDMDTETTVDPDTFLSMGRSTPFAGRKVYGVCRLTVCSGKIAYKN